MATLGTDGDSLGADVAGSFRSRLVRVREAMVRAGVDLLFLSPSANLQYLTGIHRDRPNYGNVQYPGGWVMGAWIGLERGPIVTAPRMIAEFDLPADTGLEVRSLPDHGDPFALMAGTLAEFGPVRRLAVEDRAWAESLLHLRGLLPGAEWSLASALLAPLRRVKDAGEIALMREGARLADRTMATVLPLLKVGMSEREVALEVDAQMVRLGAEGPSFTTNVFSWGPGAARDLREKGGTRSLVPGVSLSFDFGCVWEGYCSDFGRTVHFGEPSAAFVRAYDAVIAAHDAGIAAMRAGRVTAAEVDAAARGVIEEAGLGRFFVHRLGHGIGLDVHEGPFLTGNDATVLESGMAFTVEPSVYQVGEIGTRIEDVVIVGPDGGEVLNEAPNALHVVA